MDQRKIGLFIAERRKARSLTQAALGEQLGVSNKAVSKWERGICLPDVSLYQDLCMILGISLNEFFAGEFIAKENIEMTSENNLISISTTEKTHKTRLLRIITALCAVLAVFLIAVVVMAKNAMDDRSQAAGAEPVSEEPPLYHYIETWELTEGEQTILGMLDEGDPDLDLFRYNTGSSFEGGFTVDMTVFRNDAEVSGQTVYALDYWEKGRHHGEIGIMTSWDDPSAFTVQASVNGGPGADGTALIDLSEYLDESWFEESSDGRKTLRDSVGMDRSQLYTAEHGENEYGVLRIEDGVKIPLAAYAFTRDGEGGSVPEINGLRDGKFSCDAEYAVLFTVTFHQDRQK